LSWGGIQISHTSNHRSKSTLGRDWNRNLRQRGEQAIFSGYNPNHIIAHL
jgi:hypothetical protein